MKEQLQPIPLELKEITTYEDVYRIFYAELPIYA